MIVISHRGYWKHEAEKNQLSAFQRSFDLGFGTELDIRDHDGVMVVSHDVPNGSEIAFSVVLDALGGRDLPLAINIKADGLGPLLRAQMRVRPLTHWFTFDMSIPELRTQVNLDLPVFTRMSEFERDPPFYALARGVWLDSFESLWYDLGEVETMLKNGKRVCLVSPELHGRDSHTLWSALRNSPIKGHAGLILCTDRPEEAVDFMEIAHD